MPFCVYEFDGPGVDDVDNADDETSRPCSAASPPDDLLFEDFTRLQLTKAEDEGEQSTLLV